MFTITKENTLGSKTEIRVYDGGSQELAASISENSCYLLDDRDGFIGRPGLHSFEAVTEAINSEWAEGLNMFNGLLDTIDVSNLPKPVSRRRRRRFSENQGDDVDIDRLRSGQPFWSSAQRVNSNGPATVTLIAGIGGNATLKSRDIFWRGACAIILTKLLEEAGYRVEMWCASSVLEMQGEIPQALDAVFLKSPRGAIDLSTLVNCVSGWFLRTAIFSSRKTQESTGGSVGRWRSINKLFHYSPKCIGYITREENPIIIDDIFSQRDAEYFLKDTLTRFADTGRLELVKS